MLNLQRAGIAYWNGHAIETKSPVDQFGNPYCEVCEQKVGLGDAVRDDDKFYHIGCYEFEQQVIGVETPDTRDIGDVINEMVLDDIADDRMQADLAKLKKEQRKDRHYELTHTLED